MKILRKFLKWMLYILASLIIIAGLFITILLYINREDLPPSSDALYYIEARDQTLYSSEQKNAYIGLLGLAPPAELDQWQAGKKVAASLKQCSPNSWNKICKPLFEGELKITPKASEYFSNCRKEGNQCQALSAALDKPKLLAENSLLLNRYQNLLSSDYYHQTTSINIQAPLPSYQHLIQGQKLYLLQLYTLATDDIKPLLQNDLDFWRLMLKDCDILICKMVAVAGVKNHFGLAGVFLTTMPSEQKKQLLPSSWATPLSNQERSLKKSLVGEYQFFSNTTDPQALEFFYASDEAPNAIEIPFYRLTSQLFKPQASLNLAATMYRNTERTATLSFSALAAHKKKAPQPAEKIKGNFLYNPVGRLLAASSEAWIFDTYSYRITDLEGIRQLSLAAAHLDPNKDIQNQLNQLPYKNPYTGKAFSYNNNHKTINFDGLGKDGEFTLSVK
ncbi:hypothetical protein [Gilvimarinus polysaccharolyticus]|uniref:hypothetical protein n=1 Tax=Gilvimarinus polysaccharolyticus TaxID=863921 RepID=UPI000673A304|nr:hypothetical protein [Gilvimarinus polysaccharolyticus]